MLQMVTSVIVTLFQIKPKPFLLVGEDNVLAVRLAHMLSVALVVILVILMIIPTTINNMVNNMVK